MVNTQLEKPQITPSSFSQRPGMYFSWKVLTSYAEGPGLNLQHYKTKTYLSQVLKKYLSVIFHIKPNSNVVKYFSFLRCLAWQKSQFWKQLLWFEYEMSPIGFCKGLVPAGQAILGGGGNFRGWGQEKKEGHLVLSSLCFLSAGR